MPLETSPDDLGNIEHSSLDHSGIPGVGLAEKQRLFAMESVRGARMMPNPAYVTDPTLTSPDVVVVDEGTDLTITESGQASGTGYTQDALGAYVGITGGNSSKDATLAAGVESRNARRPRLVCRAHFTLLGVTVNSVASWWIGFTEGNPAPTVDVEAAAFEVRFNTSGPQTVRVLRRIGSTSNFTDTGFTPTNGVVYNFVVEYTDTNELTFTIYDEDFGTVLYTTSFSTAPNVPQLTTQTPCVSMDAGGDTSGSMFFHGLVYREGA